ncbi:MAG TPA: PilN domain-containing protein [Candidatus Eisenbacteria bacterium]|nr:PilN domain-containing protein [Candidatus Eisenbacteria bacterium]
MSHVLGIDLAPGELRVAHAERRRFGATRLVRLERIPYASDADLGRALRRLANAHPSASVLTALPLAAAAHRLLSLPFRDGRRLRETVPLELVGHLPSDPGDVAIGFDTIEATARGTTVIAAAVRRDEITALRARLAAAALVPERVALAPLPIWNLVTLADATLVVADGARSTASVRRAGRLAGLRALGASPGDLDGFVAEVRWTLDAMGGATTIVLAGPDATSELAARLDAEPIDRAASWRDPSLGACALAAGLAAGPSLTLDAARTAPAPAAHRRRVVGLAAAAALVAVADLAIVRAGLGRREAMLAEATRATAAAALPAGTRLVAPRAQLEAAVGAGTQGLRPGAVLALLRELSQRVPASVHLDLDELTLDGDVLRLHGRAEGFEAIDVLQRALAAAPGLRDVAAEDSRATVDGRGVEFALRATWGPSVGAPS